MRRSTSYALGLAFAYGGVAAIYILVSSRLAAAHATTIDDLLAIETGKGIGFVLVTTLLTFVGGLLAMRRIERDADELVRRERALLAVNGKVFAGVMAASVAHDANNVLVAVLADLEALAASGRIGDRQQIEDLRHSVGRLVDLNGRLLNAARQGTPRDRQQVELGRLVREAVATVRAHQHLRHCRIVCRGGDGLRLLTQAVLIHQVIGNLVLNAGQAMHGEGAIEVVVAEQPETVAIEVHDAGPGVPPARRATLFDGLATTKPAGTGLGLFSVRACVQSLGGSVAIEDSPLGGAKFTVRLPKQPVAVG
ncbi:MAG: HAMP domain-containing histidine kinase [Planctomycetes bacterium]|nr:HAMP domain-containing histidine kinase [Planctomycetota bacterium]